MLEEFRLGKSVKYLGIESATIFLAATIGSASIFFLEEPAKHGFKGEHSVAIVGGMGIAVSGGFLLMSLYLWAAYYVEKLTIRGTLLSIHSVFQNHEFDLSELECLNWKCRPLGGRIEFRSRGGTSYLDLFGFADDDRLKMIRLLHDLVPISVQAGWPEFCHQVALPLRDGRRSLAVTEPSSECLTVTRRRYDRMAVFGIPISLCVATILGSGLNLWQFYVVPPLLVAAWLLLRFHVPPDGLIETRLTSTPRGRALLFGWAAIVGPTILTVGLLFSGVEKSTACWIGLAVSGVALIPILKLLHQVDKQERIADEQAAKSAPDQWLQRHSG